MAAPPVLLDPAPVVYGGLYDIYAEISATSDLPMTFQWFLDGYTLENGGSVTGAQASFGAGTHTAQLHLSEWGSLGGAWIHVEVSNADGTVVSEPGDVPYYDCWHELDGGGSYYEGDPIEFQADVCWSYGATFEWIHDGLTFATGIVTDREGYLYWEISHASLEDAGDYTVRLTGDHGYAVDLPTVTVEIIPTLRLNWPDRGKLVTRREGDSLGIDISVTGGLPPYAVTISNLQGSISTDDALLASHSGAYTVSFSDANRTVETHFVLSVRPSAAPAHTSDQNNDGHISLSELLRAIQFYNVHYFHCDASTEDGYAIGLGMRDCSPCSVDYQDVNWQLSLSELLRLIQFFNAGGYAYCPDSLTEDDFCIDSKTLARERFEN
jgi:hypothetical protein